MTHANHFISNMRCSPAQYKGLRNDLRVWFGRIKFLTADRFLYELEIYLRFITRIEGNCFPADVDLSDVFSNNLISIEFQDNGKNLKCHSMCSLCFGQFLFHLTVQAHAAAKWLHSVLVRGASDSLRNSLLKAFSFNCILRSSATPL